LASLLGTEIGAGTLMGNLGYYIIRDSYNFDSTAPFHFC